MSPSTVTPPYVIPAARRVHTKSLLTVQTATDPGKVGAYRMAGIPDGLGAYRTDGNALKLLMNHELRADTGAVHKHGEQGAFVSEWTISRDSLEVTEGSDLIEPGVQYWDYLESEYADAPNAAGTRDDGEAFPAYSAQFLRFCSNNLTEPGQLFNHRTGRGYHGRVFFPNEESGVEGRTFGTLTDGTTRQLPRLGLFSWENTIAAHNRSDTTLVMGNEDTAEGHVWAYVGSKTRRASAFDKAGLTNGNNFVIDLEDEAVSDDAGFRAAVGKGVPAAFDLAEIGWDQSGAKQNAEAKAEGLSLNRVEDGAWDPRNPDDFYFLTTEGGKGARTPTGFYGRDGGGLWRLRFDDRERPLAGGTLELLLDGSEAPYLNKPDNMTIDKRGNMLIQEDPGNNVSVARIVEYEIATGYRGVLAQFNPAIFGWTGDMTPPATPTDQPVPVPAGEVDVGLSTVDEESSGIIDARSVLGRGWFLFGAQIHITHPDPELVEYGQLLAMRVASWKYIYTLD